MLKFIKSILTRSKPVELIILTYIDDKRNSFTLTSYKYVDDKYEYVDEQIEKPKKKKKT